MEPKTFVVTPKLQVSYHDIALFVISEQLHVLSLHMDSQSMIINPVTSYNGLLITQYILNFERNCCTG